MNLAGDRPLARALGGASLCGLLFMACSSEAGPPSPPAAAEQQTGAPGPAVPQPGPRGQPDAAPVPQGANADATCPPPDGDATAPPSSAPSTYDCRIDLTPGERLDYNVIFLPTGVTYAVANVIQFGAPEPLASAGRRWSTAPPDPAAELILRWSSGGAENRVAVRLHRAQGTVVLTNVVGAGGETPRATVACTAK